MEFEATKDLISRYAGRKAQVCRLKGIAGFALCPFAMAAAAVCIYGLLRVFTYRRYGSESGAACLWFAVGSLPVLFFLNRLIPRGESLMEKRMREGAPMPGIVLNRATVMLAVLAWILFTGPRLLDWAVACMREAEQWRQQDAHGCAAVLWLLASRPKKVPYEEFSAEIQWLDLNATLPQVRRIPGVLSLQTPPAGLGLTEELRSALRKGGPIEG